jgi:hypothetical protein
MQNRSVSFVTFAGVLILAVGHSADNPAGQASQINSSGTPLNSVIKPEIASGGA